MDDPSDKPLKKSESKWRRAAIFMSIVGLVWVVAARVLGPSDVWHQTQPKTMSYTTDIIVHGGSHWILPIELGELPATKPPLYNWLAAPWVKLLGFSSEIGHKFPSLLALMLGWLILVKLGNAIEGECELQAEGETDTGETDTKETTTQGRGLDSGGGMLGWLAGLFFVANYTIFKLGYLARPDMLLCLWLLLAWIAATFSIKGVGSLLHADKKDSRPLYSAGVFWGCVALAGLTKGPPAIVPILYVLIAAKPLGGSWRSINRLYWWWGLPLSLGVIALWLFGVYLINPVHLTQELWFNEIYGRITGQGANVDGEGFGSWIKDLPDMSLYFLVRFAPWSIAAIGTMLWMIKRSGPSSKRNMHQLPHAARPWLIGAAIFLLLVLVLFSLSTGKRADYVAVAFAPASLLAAWWWLRIPPRWGVRLPGLVPMVAAITLGALTTAHIAQTESSKPMPGFSQNLSRFIDATSDEIASKPGEVGFIWTTHLYLKTFMGYSEPDSLEKIEALIEKGEPFWIVAGRKKRLDEDFATWYGQSHANVQLTAVVRSDDIEGDPQFRIDLHKFGLPEQLTLYRATPISGNPQTGTSR